MASSISASKLCCSTRLETRSASGGHCVISLASLTASSSRLSCAHQPVEQAEAIGFLRVDGAAGEDQIGGAGIADDARQEIAHAGIRRQAALDEHGLEARELGADAQIGGERRAHAGACRDAVDRGDHGLVELMEHLGPAADPAVFVEPLGLRRRRREALPRIAGRDSGEIGAGTEAAARCR